jgi:hypothetical protein
LNTPHRKVCLPTGIQQGLWNLITWCKKLKYDGEEIQGRGQGWWDRGEVDLIAIEVSTAIQPLTGVICATSYLGKINKLYFCNYSSFAIRLILNDKHKSSKIIILFKVGKPCCVILFPEVIQRNYSFIHLA